MTVSGIISALVVGLVIGVLGRLVAPGKQKIPFWLTILAGIAAAFAGTAVARGIGYADTEGWDWLEFFTQVGIAAVGVTILANVWPRKRIRH